MSRTIGIDTICLRPTPRLAHTEYSMSYHKSYLEKLGKPIEEAWEFDFLWCVHNGPLEWSRHGRVTDMGHAVYAADGSDQRLPAQCTFEDVEDVYAFWCAFETYPRFMTHVREIRRFDGGRLRWRVEGPGGTEFQWDAEITSEKPNEELSWRSLPGSSIHNEGVVRFYRWGDGTQIEIQMAYNPPAGVVGHAIAKLFGKDPKREIDEDLIRFKSLLEAGKATGRESTVTRDEISAQVHPGASS
jgi:hypothetical protein